LLTLKEEHRLRVLRIFGPERNKVTGSGENYKMSLMICTPHPVFLG
jgi:hypothetical protein